MVNNLSIVGHPGIVYHHYFTDDHGATYQTGCGVPIVPGEVMPELNHVTCSACLKAYDDKMSAYYAAERAKEDEAEG